MNTNDSCATEDIATSYVMRRISKEDSKNAFDCGIDALNAYWNRFAYTNDQNGIGATFIAEYQGLQTQIPKILGYYTICMGTITIPEDSIKIETGIKNPPKYPLPSCLLARLAVQKSLQGQGFGGALLWEIFTQITTQFDAIGYIGIHLDAKNEKAIQFYKKYGFSLIDTNTRLMFISRKKIAAYLDYAASTD